ncbi:hypothetical protein KAJ27_10595 [bacterium]|nr:hypothetical protein [bacterium]
MKKAIALLIFCIIVSSLSAETMYVLDHLQKDSNGEWNLVFNDKDGNGVIKKEKDDPFCMSKLTFIKINREEESDESKIDNVVLGLSDRFGNLWSVYLFGDYLKETSPNRIKIIRKDKLFFDKKNPESLKRFNSLSKPGEYGSSPDDQFGFLITKKWKTLVGGIFVMSLSRGKKDELLIGTRNSGLLLFDEKKKRIQRITVKSSDNKLPSDTVTATRRIDGDVWIGTNKGLIIWDGLNFKDVDAANGLIKENIITDIESTEKRIFVGTTMGLTVINKDGGWTSYTKENGLLANNQITRIVATTDNLGREKIIIGTKKGSFIFNVNGSIPFGGTIGDDWINDVVIDRIKPGGIWFCYPGGVEKFPFEEETLDYTYSTVKYQLSNGLPEGWIKTLGVESYLKIQGHSPKWIRASHSGSNSNIMDEPYKKILWVGGMKSIYSWDSVSWTEYDFEVHKIPGSKPQKILIDNGNLTYVSDNRIYLGTDKGLSVYKSEEKFPGIPPFTGIMIPNAPWVHDFIKYQGDMWIATNSGPANLSQLTLYSNNRPCRWPLYDNKIVDLEVVDQGHLIGAINNGGLFVYNGFGEPKIYDHENCKFPSDDITAVFYDSKNTMVYCAVKKCGSLNERLFKFPFHEPLKWEWVDDERNKPVENRKHMLDARYEATEKVTGFAKVGENLYVGTLGSGLYEIGPKLWKCYKDGVNTTHGVEGNYISKLKVDSFQNLWIGTDEGLTRMCPDGKWEIFKDGIPGCNLSQRCFLDFDFSDQTAFRIWGLTGGHVHFYDGNGWWNFVAPSFLKVYCDFPHLWLWKSGLWIIKMNAVNLTHHGELLIKGCRGKE